MRKIWSLILLFISCTDKFISKPILLNDHFDLSPLNDTIILKTIAKEWDVNLYGLYQPIPVNTVYKEGILKVIPQNGYLVPSSTIHLLLSFKNNYYIYEFQYINNYQDEFIRTFRSPKTMNPDSSLIQYIQKHTVTELRNIIISDSTKEYFKEYEHSLPSIAGIYNDKHSTPISSYYIQPGSPTELILYISIDSTRKSYSIETNYLTDHYGNEIANGTLISYFIDSGASKKIIERQIMNGCSTLLLPGESFQPFRIYSIIGLTISNAIYIN